MRKIDTELSNAQQEFLRSYGIDPECVDHHVPATELHEYMVSGEAWVDDEWLIFINMSNDDVDRFMYYMGEEDNSVDGRQYGVTIFELDSERIEWLVGSDSEED